MHGVTMHATGMTFAPASACRSTTSTRGRSTRSRSSTTIAASCRRLTCVRVCAADNAHVTRCISCRTRRCSCGSTAFRLSSSTSPTPPCTHAWYVGATFARQKTLSIFQATAARPQQDFVALQNLDNSIAIYQAGEKFRLQPKKVFRGHVCAGTSRVLHACCVLVHTCTRLAGYSAQVAWSADGKYLASGDGNGRAFFWDFKSTKLFRTLKCHDGVCISLAWHPIDACVHVM
jgi:WD40 repeat protein